MGVPFTQYLRPCGTPAARLAPLPDGWSQQDIDVLLCNGYYYEAEVLSGGEVALYVYDCGDNLVKMAVVPNGPPVSDAVAALSRVAREHLNAASA